MLAELVVYLALVGYTTQHSGGTVILQLFFDRINYRATPPPYNMIVDIFPLPRYPCSKIKSNTYHFPPHVKVSQAAKNLIRKILHIDPSKSTTTLPSCFIIAS